MVAADHNQRLAELVAERERRNMEVLRVFRPLPYQIPFFTSRTPELIIRGGNRCLGGETEIYDPVAGISRRVDQIDGDFHVHSMDEHGRLVIAKAEKPFTKPVEKMYRVSLTNGESFVCTMNHRMRTLDGRYLPVHEILRNHVPVYSVESRRDALVPRKANSEIRQDFGAGRLSSRSRISPVSHLATGSFENSYSLLSSRHLFSNLLKLWCNGVRVASQFHSRSCHLLDTTCGLFRELMNQAGRRVLCDAVRCFQAVADFRSDYLGDCRSCGERLLSWSTSFQYEIPSLGGERERTRHHSHLDGLDSGSACTRMYPRSDRLSMPGSSCLSTVLAYVAGCRKCGGTCSLCSLRYRAASLCQRLRDLSSGMRRLACALGYRGQLACEAPENSENTEKGQTTYIDHTEFIRTDKVYDFTVPHYHNYALAGTIHHNSGKTTSAAVLFASLALNQPIIGPDNNPLPSPWPEHWGSTGHLLWIVGYDEKHVGQTLHRALFKPGAFRLIRDLETNNWRVYQPWNESDEARAMETVPSEPLIPERYIKQWAWKDKASSIFESVTLNNGTVICAYSSRGNPKQGDKVHCIWIDEDIEYSHHIGEYRARLADYSGRLLWSAFPHSKNEALVEMSEQAIEQRTWTKPIVEEIQVSLHDNPYIKEDQKDRLGITLTDDLERSARIHGNFIYDSFLVYPTFSKKTHCCPHPDESAHDEIDKIIASGQRPVNWTRYLAIDPGFTRTAVVFAAVPPPFAFETLPKDERYLIIEGEIYVKGQTVDEIAKLVRNYIDGFIYESFVIDWHAARQTPMTGGKTIYQQFYEVFAKHGITSNLMGSHFVKGNDDITGRIEIVRKYLAINKLGKPRLRLYGEKTPGLQKEFARYKFRQGPNGFVDEKPVKKHDHALDALGYLVSMDPEWIDMDYTRKKNSAAYDAFKRIQDREKQKANQGSRFVNLGPAS